MDKNIHDLSNEELRQLILSSGDVEKREIALDYLLNQEYNIGHLAACAENDPDLSLPECPRLICEKKKINQILFFSCLIIFITGFVIILIVGR
jgi:hypothetical protein